MRSVVLKELLWWQVGKTDEHRVWELKRGFSMPRRVTSLDLPRTFFINQFLNPKQLLMIQAFVVRHHYLMVDNCLSRHGKKPFTSISLDSSGRYE